MLLLAALLGATAPATEARGSSSSSSRKLAGDSRGGGGGSSGGRKGGGSSGRKADATTTATTTYSPSHTLTVAKRATVSLADYERDPNDGPWRPDEFFSSARRSARHARGRRNAEGEEAEETNRLRRPSPSPSDEELLASIPLSVREAALRQAAPSVGGEQGDDDDAAADDDDINAADDDENSALPTHKPKQKRDGAIHPKARRVRAFDTIDAFEATYALDPDGVTSYEPPDSAVAVGNGLVAVAVNSVLAFYRARDGRPLSAPIPARDLLAVDFPASDPYLLDPSLSYDPEVGRWFYSVARLETDEEGSLTGGSSLEVAVSASADPFRGDGWAVYSIPSTNTGGDSGTLAVPACVEAGSCLSDYGQMRVSGDGLWLAANVVTFLEQEGEEGDLVGASVYALSKWALADQNDEVAVAQWYLDSLPQDGGEPAYTLMPALVGDPWSVDGCGGGKGNGKATTNTNNANAAAHFMSVPHSRARDFLIHYLLTGARALHDADVSPETLQDTLRLRVSRVPVPNPWPLLPFGGRDVWQPQRGNFPLGESIGEPEPGKIGGPDTKIMGLALAQGRLVAVYQVLKPQREQRRKERSGGANPNAPPQLFTAAAWAQVDVGGGHKDRNTNTPKTEAFGTIDADGADVIYPNVALAASGRGGVGAGLSGKATKPSAIVVPFSLSKGAGKMRVSGPGKGLQDGRSQYTDRPRFGDYSGSAVEFGLWVDDEGGDDDGGKGSGGKADDDGHGAVWFSSEYIAQSCTLAEFEGDEGVDDDDDSELCPLYTCGCARAENANYAMRVTRLETAA
jgi:hypothetical protein